MRNAEFRFKKFSCFHGKSAMKIGVDAVLIGAWTDVTGCNSILDVGTGCGVISLMCAQRNNTANIVGIDIDENSIDEAMTNFERSPWADRLSASLVSFNEVEISNLDLIISNPPYFDSGVSEGLSSRLKARHQAELSPKILIDKGKSLLSDTGRIAMVVPAEQYDELVSFAENVNMKLKRVCYVKGHPNAPIKRVLLEFTKSAVDVTLVEHLTLESSVNFPTDQHRALCKDFYLKF